VIVVCDSSPLIALAKIDSFLLLQKLHGGLIISREVYEEVVVAGAGLAGAADTSKSTWIEVRQIKNPADLTVAQTRFGLGVGELSTMILAKEIRADLVILDDLGARKLAQKEGLKVQGCIAILEACFRKGFLPDLRQAYDQLLKRGVYLNRQLLNLSLESFNLPAI
jgi:predicted nucleic acid-binding protein